MAEREFERIFVGWERPFLQPAVERWLVLVRERELDSARCVIVLPGRRAARRVEDLVAELAPTEMVPPRVITEGALASVLSRERLSLASPLARTLAWRQALRDATADERAALWASNGGDVALAGLAKLCARTFAQLAAEALDAQELARRASAGAVLGDERRWQALAAIERRYREQLASSGLVDPAAAAREVVRRGLVRDDLHVSTFALVDPPRAQRELLARLRGRVASFVFAPPSLAGEFDELGALRIERWADRDLPIDAGRWRVVDTPDDQARAALEHLTAIAATVAPEDVSIGVPDLEVLPFLERRLLDAGCEPRWAGGTSLADSRVATLLGATRAWLAERRFEEYAALLRHPDLERALARATGLELGRIPSVLDRHAQRHVPAFADGEWLADSDADELTRIHAALLEALGNLGDPAERSLASWADAVADLCARVWPQVELAARDVDQAAHAHALESLASILQEARDAGTRVQTRAHEALELFEERMRAEELPPRAAAAGRPVIELFGWLELALDDAPELVLTGANEGALPQAAGNDAWLFESARRALGLVHEARRVARDTWALSAILASRPRTLLVSGRRGAQRDPRTPSRLLFRCPPEALVERVRRAWPRDESARAVPVALATRYELPRIEAAPPREISVTGIKVYLRSPYEFYLRHVLGLETVDDRAHELDPSAFGQLAHRVLQRFGDSAAKHSDDERAIADMLLAELDVEVARRFGPRAKAAVRLQVEKLRLRLERFARWQAEQTRMGWRIHSVELEPARRNLGAPGRGLALRGRIDRLDHHAAERRWRVLDYKTGDARKSPREQHRRGERWIDLQLPLYRWLLADTVEVTRLEDGYVALDAAEDAELYAQAKWKDGELDDALARAHEVAELVLRGEFGEVGDTAPREPIFAALCGFGLVGFDDEDDES